MALTESIRDTGPKVPADSCAHCAKGWVYDQDPDTGEEIALGCWMCPEGKAIDKAGAR